MDYVTSLYLLLSKHFYWHKSRIETLCMLILALFKIQNVQLPQLAISIDSEAKQESSIKRIYRFFKHQIIDQGEVVMFLKKIMKIELVTLIIDRTNWEFGKTKINVLYLAISYQHIAIPIFFKILDNKGGNSKAADRIELMEQFLKLFSSSSIKAILGDREFFDQEWIEFLHRKRIKFCFRIKSNKKVKHSNGGMIQAKTMIDNFPHNITVHSNKSQTIYGAKLMITMKKMKSDYFISIGPVINLRLLGGIALA
jgi:Transposase DDE domain